MYLIVAASARFFTQVVWWLAVQMCFRGQLSTSNVIASDTIDVTTDEDLLWITAIGALLYFFLKQTEYICIVLFE